MPHDENSPRGFHVVAYRIASSHKCNIVTSANCAEANLDFLMAYVHTGAIRVRIICCKFNISVILSSSMHH